MGAKYLPTIKDQKASLRFLQKQNRVQQLKKTAPVPPAKPDKSK